MTDFFLSHDWGTDEVGRDTHERVGKVNEALQSLGFTTWYDEEQLTGDILDQMSRGIEKTKVLLAFITRNYANKVTGDISSDNCKLEFNHAVRVLSNVNILAVVMDSSMTKTKDWNGVIGLQLGNKLYVNMTGNVNDPVYLNAKVQEMLDIVKTFPRMGGTSDKVNAATSAEEAVAEELTKEEKANEIKASRAKSSRAQIKFTVFFTNKRDEDVDLIWKNYEGGEVTVRQGMEPGKTHGERTFLTHPFIARDVITEKVCYFQKEGKKKPVFEGMDFGAPDGGEVHVDIV